MDMFIFVILPTDTATYVIQYLLSTPFHTLRIISLAIYIYCGCTTNKVEVEDAFRTPSISTQSV